jgi:hypothetical protein
VGNHALGMVMFAKCPTRIFRSAEAEPVRVNPTKIDNRKIETFVRDCRCCQSFGATTIGEVAAVRETVAPEPRLSQRSRH